MKFLLALLILLLGVSSGLAAGNKRLRAIPYAIIQCPYPVDNGCSSSQPLQANSGAVLLANARQAPAGNMINLLTGNPTDYSAISLPRNQPAIDYPVGAYKSFTALKQINNTTATAAGCTYNATGSVGGSPLVTCTPGVGATINFVDFDMTNGGTTCVGLKISGDNGTMNISDVYWLNNGICAVSAPQPVMLVTSGRNTATTNVSFVTLDANVANFPYMFGACARDTATTPALACNPYEAYLVSGDFHIDHSAFIGFPARPLQYFAADVTVGSFAQYNALVGCCSLQASAHSEYEEYLGPTGGAGMTWIGNTFISTTFHHTSGFAAFPVWLGNAAGPVPVFDMENNFYVDAMAGGGGSNTIPTWAGSISGGIFTTSSVTGGKLGSGMQSTCGAARSVGGVGTFEVNFLPIYAGLSGTQSAGPGGGGYNTLSNGAQFNMSWSQTVVTAGIDNGSGNNPTYTATFNKATGALTITSAVTGGTVATGQIISGAGIPGQPVISSGSGTNWVTTTPGGGSGILSGVTIVSGTPGNVVNVSVDNALVLVPGTNGDTIGFLSGAGTRTLTAFGTASGTTGTYTADASGYSPQAQLTATPFDVWPGGWSVPGTLTCASQTSAFRAASFSKPFMVNQGTMGQVTATGNYLDLWAYGNTPLGSATIVNNNAVLQTFNGTITSGTTLTVNSGTTPTVGRYITTDSGVVANTLITGSLGGGQFSITPSQANLGPVSMVATETYCTTGPTVFGSPGNNPNVDMSGINPESTMDSYGTSAISGNGCSAGYGAYIVSLPSGHVMHFIAPTGSDAADGLAATVGGGHGPWATPNHSVSCGDIIVATAGAYPAAGFQTFGTVSNCPSSSGGIDGTGGVNFAALLCGGSDLEACHMAYTGSSGWAMDVRTNNWAVEGFKITGNFGQGAFGANGQTATVHHIAFINNIASNVPIGFGAADGGVLHDVPGSTGFDYIAFVGNIAQNAEQNTVCTAAIAMAGPATVDTNSGTHIAYNGNFSYAHGNNGCSIDIEDYIIDTWDAHGYVQDTWFSNNVGWSAYRFGLQVFTQNFNSVTGLHVYVDHNTFFHDTLTNVGFMGDMHDAMNNTTAPFHIYSNNISLSDQTNGYGSIVGGSSGPTSLANITQGGTGIENIYFGINGAVNMGAFNGFSYTQNSGANFAENPTFANTTDLLASRSGAPNCTGFENVVQCMGYDASTATLTTPSVISDLVPSSTHSAGKGYQKPTGCGANARYPTWLKGVVYLHWNGSIVTENPGLVTKPCGL